MHRARAARLPNPIVATMAPESKTGFIDDRRTGSDCRTGRGSATLCEALVTDRFPATADWITDAGATTA
jgi:hypothetical protein